MLSTLQEEDEDEAESSDEEKEALNALPESALQGPILMLPSLSFFVFELSLPCDQIQRP